MRSALAAVAALTFAIFACAGCQQFQTAPPAYRFANQARYNAVRPWMDDYATLRPELAPRVRDTMDSWGKEIEAQQAAATQPTR